MDNRLSTASHLVLTEAGLPLEPQTFQGSGAFRGLVDTRLEMSSNRAQIEARTGQPLSSIEWIGLLFVLAILMVLSIVPPGGTLWGALIAGALAATLVTLVVLLRKLDLLRRHEWTSIWEPTTGPFVDYPDPYPNRTTKIISIEHLTRGPWVPAARAAVDR